jgi:hypothetical protein
MISTFGASVSTFLASTSAMRLDTTPALNHIAVVTQPSPLTWLVTCLPPLVCALLRSPETNAVSPSPKTQLTPSLFRAPTCKSTDPVRNRQLSYIHVLNYDVLFDISNIYRLDIRDQEEEDRTVHRWDRLRSWYKLAQVSREYSWVTSLTRPSPSLHVWCPRSGHRGGECASMSC